MSDGATATFTVAFHRSGRPRTPHSVSLGRAPRVARQFALAHEIDRRIRAGELEDLAHVARVFGLTRTRVTQITNLLLLAPAIQEAILAMPPVTIGRVPITERMLRPIVAEPVWERQAEMWGSLVGIGPITPSRIPGDTVHRNTCGNRAGPERDGHPASPENTREDCALPQREKLRR